LCATDEPGVAFYGGECSFYVVKAFNVGTALLADNDIATLRQRTMRKRVPRYSTHDDGAAESDLFESLQISGVVPRQLPGNTDHPIS
jgi:hypothetical protein